MELHVIRRIVKWRWENHWANEIIWEIIIYDFLNLLTLLYRL